MKRNLPIITFMIGVLLWIPNVAFQETSLLWLFTPLIGGSGAYISFKGKQSLLMVLNLMIVFSFPIVMFFGTMLWGP